MEIRGKFIYADKGKFLHRIGSDVYGVQSSLLDGDTIESFEQVDKIPEPKETEEIRNRIAELKAELTATDYISLKAFEGGDVSNHPNWKEKRQALRDEINKLEGQLK